MAEPKPEGTDSLSGQSPESSPLPAPFDSNKQDFKSAGGSVVNEESYKGLSTLGSRPPSCDHKCGECSPCEAIQVPTKTFHFGIQYANYEPEGWKCKCGTSFFNP
ncbi:EPIDERMAL PATTERNING FACTOR-like protein 3 isoform X2 [Macadamia integrifolia]|uniref:EPIDERMAL PATTERNING FACTOR-like protein 3 isoform X2 n=1 Tax=Macadamia integrifolia TaxID=60698 RepID=UPI001C4F5D11|nr:EPIDERMAL PATTERNING FACTOR-like protein 3 isoform X2 [Macadamia integrifolia]